MTPEDYEIENEIMSASDKEEAHDFNGNMIIRLTIQSSSVGKKVVYTYTPTGGLSYAEVTDI